MGQMPFLLPDTVSQKLIHYTFEKIVKIIFKDLKRHPNNIFEEKNLIFFIKKSSKKIII